MPRRSRPAVATWVDATTVRDYSHVAIRHVDGTLSVGYLRATSRPDKFAPHVDDFMDGRSYRPAPGHIEVMVLARETVAALGGIRDEPRRPYGWPFTHDDQRLAVPRAVRRLAYANGVPMEDVATWVRRALGHEPTVDIHRHYGQWFDPRTGQVPAHLHHGDPRLIAAQCPNAQVGGRWVVGRTAAYAEYGDASPAVALAAAWARDIGSEVEAVEGRAAARRHGDDIVAAVVRAIPGMLATIDGLEEGVRLERVLIADEAAPFTALLSAEAIRNAALGHEMPPAQPPLPHASWEVQPGPAVRGSGALTSAVFAEPQVETRGRLRHFQYLLPLSA